jgi:hypothetical protein
MKYVKKTLVLNLLLLLALSMTQMQSFAQSNSSTAQPAQDVSSKNSFFKSDEWFFSWGYNKTHYANSNININQPSLGNNFTVNAVQGHDEFSHLTCCSPDNLRLGRYLNEEKTYALDLSLDHTKFTSTIGQVATITGKNSGGVGNQVLSNDYFSYMLHNGLNHVMVNLSYRKPLLGNLDETSNLAFIGKVGTGLAIVHPYSVVNGSEYQMGKKTLTNPLGFDNGWWRIVGTSTGVELGMRYTFMKPFYMEWTNKQVFTNMRNVPVFQGSASQNLRSNEIIFSVGYTFDPKHSLF